MTAKIHSYFKAMAKQRASDLHITVGYPPHLRVFGKLTPLAGSPLTSKSVQTLLFEILTPEQKAQLEKKRDFEMIYNLKNVGRFRCNFLFQQRGVGAVVRYIPAKIPSLDDLKLPEIIKKIISSDRGLVLVTSPPGNGKSTTIAAIINYINTNFEKHIITIEKPLEFIHTNQKSLCTQREIGVHAKNYAEALYGASREDPDVILLGDMQDPETLLLAANCAEQGMLVFGSIHTPSATSTVERIFNAFPQAQLNQARTMMAESLKAVISQQLVPTRDGKGFCPAVEILMTSQALASSLREGNLNQVGALIQTGRSQGMQGMDNHLKKLIEEEVITIEAARAKALDKTLFVIPKKDDEDDEFESENV